MKSDRAGVIPFRRRSGELEVLLITSRATGQWSIPKGRLEPGLDAPRSAAREAFEEAGVTGRVHPCGIGSYRRKGPGITQQVQVFLLEVRTELPHWPEEHQRQRGWFSLRAAAAQVEEEGLRKLILSLPDHLGDHVQE
jgi:8-oxo-dGTP pyrophosphatase MutT (NUDIX family)